MAEYQHYPLWMKKEGWPDRLAVDAESEEKIAANGYIPGGNPDPAAFSEAQEENPEEEPYLPQEYPKWVGGRIVDAPAEASPEPAENEGEEEGEEEENG